MPTPLLTPQIWKFRAAIPALFLAVAGYLFNEPAASALGLSRGPIVLAAVSLSILGLAWLSLSIRCPKCGLALFFHAISKQSLQSWGDWLYTVSTCPRCGFHHDAHSTGSTEPMP